MAMSISMSKRTAVVGLRTNDMGMAMINSTVNGNGNDNANVERAAVVGLRTNDMGMTMTMPMSMSKGLPLLVSNQRHGNGNDKLYSKWR